YGGAVYVTGPFRISDCRFTDCHASGANGGGALYVGPNADAGLSAFLERSTLDACTSAGPGGAVRFLAGFGQLEVTSCTITGNHAAGGGGGLRVEGALIHLRQVTVTDNISDATNG